MSARAWVLAAAAFAAGVLPAAAQSVISPDFEGTVGAFSLSSGSSTLQTSGSQTGAIAMSRGSSVIYSGFLSFLLGGFQVQQGFSTADGAVTLTVPANALPLGTVVNFDSPSPSPTGGGEGLTALPGSDVEILAGGQEPAASCTLSLSYASASLIGFNPALFVIAYFNPANATWVPLQSQVNTTSQVVTASISHFSIYQIMQADPSGSIADVKIYPNPLRPALGETAMNFINLPANCGLRIYTLRGRLVRTLSADASGMAVWDGNNQAGNPAASGVYFVYGQCGGRSTFDVAIQR